MRFTKITLGFLLILVSAFSTFAANSLDLTFNAVPSKATVDAPYDKGQVVQPDGKVIVWGGYLAADGLAKGYVARLNADGTVDPSFTYCSCQFIRFINAFVQPDGKILFGGVNGAGQAQVVRLNSNGSIDGGFNSQIPVQSFTTAEARVWAVQPDGKILVEKFRTNGNPPSVSDFIYRLNTDGSVDSGFTVTGPPPVGGTNYYRMTDLALLPDGKFLIASYGVGPVGSDGFVVRKNADGTSDPTWTNPDFTPSFGFNQGTLVLGISVQADGAVIAAGRFEEVNGVSKKNLVRILPAGNVDLTFTGPTTFHTTYQPHVLPDGKILLTASTDGGNTRKLFRLNSDGSLDTFRAGDEKAWTSVTVNPKEAASMEAVSRDVSRDKDVEFAPASTILDVQNRYELDAAGNIYFFGKSETSNGKFFRLTPAGAEDPNFIPNVAEFGKVYDIARQLDGKVIFIGEFAQVGGVARSFIARVNSDGTLDTSFDPGTGFNQMPANVLIQPDGKILVQGNFTVYNGTTVGGGGALIRLNPDGSLDNTWNNTSVSGAAMALQADGKLVVAGAFTTPRTGLARLNTDGSLDAGFNPTIGSPNLRAVIVAPDGKITFAGSFNGVNGFNKNRMARLNADGTLDQTFNLAQSDTPQKVVLLPGGKYLISYSNGSEINVRRINADGSTDGTFTLTRFTRSFNQSGVAVNDIALQQNGKIMVGGDFYEINGNTIRFNLVRLNVNGGLDTSYVQNDPNGQVRTLFRQPDGKFLIGGDFYAVEGTTRAGIARINTGEAARLPQFDFDGDGKADIGVFRPSDGNWYLAQSTNGFAVNHFGMAGDLVSTADYDGDAKSDLAIYRDGAWWYINSSNSTLGLKSWGGVGDIPLPSDFDGDGKADFIYYRPTTGEWFRSGSLGSNSTVQWGIAGDQPVIGDFDGDGKADPAIFRPSDGMWWYLSSVTGIGTPVQWGQTGDIPIPADYDGDGKTDIGVFRPSVGGWYIYYSSNGSFASLAWGLSGDKPVPADYDGDGRADVAVYRPSNGVWFIIQSTGGFTGMQYGLAADEAIPNAYIP